MACLYKFYISLHWHRNVKNIRWANQNIGGQKVVKSGKCMGFSQLLGEHVLGLLSLKSFFFGRDWAGSASDWKCPEEALFSRMNVYLCVCVCNRNRKLLISRAPTKAKSQEPAYSQGLNQNKIDRQRSRSRESGRQTVRRLWWMVFGVETRR